MEIQLYTGFEKVHHNIKFQPATAGKGKDLCESDHISNVVEIKVKNQSKISANCIRQTNVTSEEYSVELKLDCKRNVIENENRCTCTYNQSAKCKHIAALIYYINSDRSLTKTDCEQQWGKPSKKALINAKYAKGPSAREMFSVAKKKYVCPNQPPQLEEFKSPSHLKSILTNKAKDKDDIAIELLLKKIKKNQGLNVIKEDCNICLENFSCFLEDYTPYMNSSYLLNYDLQRFFISNIVMTDDEIAELCCQTTQQSKCPEWFKARKVRISASANVHSIITRRTKSVESMVDDILNPKKFSSDATEYGTKNEPTAREIYSKMYGVEVKQLGLLVSHAQPWLCASLDGVVVKDGEITKIVEIKCPTSCKDKVIVDLKNKISNVEYLVIDNNKVMLEKSQKYYTQCKIQMYVTGLSVCDLFVYTPVKNGSIRIDVFRNDCFLENAVLTRERFYFEKVLPCLKASIEKENINPLLLTNGQKDGNNNNNNCFIKRPFTNVDISNKMRA